MADSSVQITAGSGTPIRVLTGLGATSADQQVVTLADSAGNLLGTAGAPFPTQQQGALPAGTNTVGNVGNTSTVVTGTLAALNASVGGNGTDASLYGQVRLQITGTFSGAVSYLVSNDGVNWVSKNLLFSLDNSLWSATTGSTGVWYGDIGARYFMAQMTSYTSGTATVTLQFTAAPATVGLSFVALSAGTNYAARVRITDGTNNGTVKAASTAAVAADTAQVVALHPSSPAYLAPSTLVVTATAAAATAVTATLAAPGAGLSHYITAVRIERFMTAAGTGAGTATLTGGTNHALVFNLPTDAATIGTQSVPVDFRPTTPLKVTAAATATTFTAPAVTATIYRITVAYYIAA